MFSILDPSLKKWKKCLVIKIFIFLLEDLFIPWLKRLRNYHLTWIVQRRITWQIRLKFTTAAVTSNKGEITSSYKLDKMMSTFLEQSHFRGLVNILMISQKMRQNVLFSGLFAIIFDCPNFAKEHYCHLKSPYWDCSLTPGGVHSRDILSGPPMRRDLFLVGLFLMELFLMNGQGV